MRVLVTGASSTPGYKIVLELAKAGYTPYAQYFTNEIPSMDNVVKVRLDLRNTEEVVRLIDKVKPNVVIHAAAIGDADRCEIDKRLAWEVNVEATYTISKKLSKLNSYMMYISTDYVFDGERGLYREDDVPNPINYYGVTKLIAENIVRSSIERHVIIRTSQIYGFGMGRVNFARHIVNSLSRGQKVRALTDQWLSPTLNTLLARAVKELMELEYVGVLHVAGERISRFDFALSIANKFGFDRNLIEPITMESIGFKAKRPKDSSLDVSRAMSILKTDFHTISKSLETLYREWVELKRDENCPSGRLKG